MRRGIISLSVKTKLKAEAELEIQSVPGILESIME